MNNICDYIVNQNYPLDDALVAIETALDNRTHSNTVRGELGELAVGYTLLALQEKFPDSKAFQSVLLKKDDRTEWTNEIDFVYVTPFAIFVIESKSFYGRTTIGKDQKFTVKPGKGAEYVADVVYQNQQHCRTVYGHVFDLIKGSECVKPIVAMFSKGRIKDNRSTKDRNDYPVLNVENMYNYIYRGLSNGKTEVVDVEKVVERILTNDTYSKENMHNHISRIKEAYN